jgi:hypothetical protein
MDYNSVSCHENKWYCCMKEMYHFFVLLIIEISFKKHPDTFTILLYKNCLLKADTFPTPVPTLLLKPPAAHHPLSFPNYSISEKNLHLYAAVLKCLLLRDRF